MFVLCTLLSVLIRVKIKVENVGGGGCITSHTLTEY